MKRKNGFTLIELIITIVLVSLIVTVGTNILIFGMRTQEATAIQFDMQANVRLMAMKVNDAIRSASGLYLLDKKYPDGSIALEDYLSEGWNYMMMNADHTALVEWVWNGTSHVESPIVSAVDGVTFDIVYEKHEAAVVNNLLEYKLTINSSSATKSIVSELESLNTLQVMDKSYGGAANTLAYREDERLTDVGVAQAAVSFVIDKSGSMNYNLNGKTRMTVLKSEATKMVQGLSSNENVYLSISPFSYTANSTTGDNLNQMMLLKTNLSRFIGDGSIINNLSPEGNTNTGDGMRRGFKAIEAFNALDENKDKTTKNFMIILVDGETNRASLYNYMTDHTISYSGAPAAHKIQDVNGVAYNFDHWDDSFWGTDKFYYNRESGSGTITVNDKPAPHNLGTDYIFDHWADYYFTTDVFYYRYIGTFGPTYVLNDQNVEMIFDTIDSEFDKNQLYANGAVPDNTTGYKEGTTSYVNEIGKLIKGYKNTRFDGIETYVIGFSPDAKPSGLQDIAQAVGSTNGTQKFTGTDNKEYKYYKADTAAALTAVLDEIKFQISEALWHIGGPN